MGCAALQPPLPRLRQRPPRTGRRQRHRPPWHWRLPLCQRSGAGARNPALLPPRLGCSPATFRAVGYPCKGRGASTLTTKAGKYACPKNRFCVRLYVTANAPFAFDFSALTGMASESCGVPVMLELCSAALSRDGWQQKRQQRLAASDSVRRRRACCASDRPAAGGEGEGEGYGEILTSLLDLKLKAARRVRAVCTWLASRAAGLLAPRDAATYQLACHWQRTSTVGTCMQVHLSQPWHERLVRLLWGCSIKHPDESGHPET